MTNFNSTADVLGKIGLPEPVVQLATRSWDVIVVGAGHNGLACAAYLARAGKKVLVLEARERVGGACTLEEPWPGYRVSPCAYLCGLLHPLVIDELGLRAHGFDWTPASSGMFVPFDDGDSVQLWEDDEKCDAEIRRLSPGDLAGWRALCDLKQRLRDAIRPADENDLWIGAMPSREEIENRLGNDDEMRSLLFDWSMAEFVERYLDDERLQVALLGQGVIGTNASPFDAGTAFVHFHHSSGQMDGQAGTWGYVKGGMGTVSFMMCDVAQDVGAVIATGVPVAEIVPGEGVYLMGGERIQAPIVISNADPRTTMRLLGHNADDDWKTQVEAIPMTGCTVKLNVGLRELPNFNARPGVNEPHHYGQVNTPLSKREWQENCQIARDGHLPERLWTELYFQTAFDASIAPDGKHVMSVFAQYVPFEFADGDWDSRRQEVEALALGSIGRFCSNFLDVVEHVEVMGPPDIEEKVGLAGGHIFQGECLPDYMWDKRLSCQTPMDGVYLCGAGTHPGGSVIGVNGRNAAMAVLQMGR